MQHTHLHLSISSSLRSAITGTQEISFQDSLNADFDVAVATKRFRFSLIPKVFLYFQSIYLFFELICNFLRLFLNLFHVNQFTLWQKI